jgi:hypothetical protein
MPQPPLYITRADLGWSATSPAAYADPESGLVVHYDGSDQGLPDGDLDDFLTYWRNTRAFHTGPSRGWADIGYSFAATPQGYVVEGRGLHREQAAQPGGNRTHYSVSLGLGPGEDPTPEQINAVRYLRAWLMTDHSVSGTVLGHRDFISTSCPGSRAYALVQDGTFTQAPGAITTPEGDPMLGLKKGDSGKAVKLLQLKLKNIGGDVAAALLYPGGPADGVDSDYGDSVAESVRLARKSMGSKALAGWGDVMTPDAVEQVDRAYARRQAEIMIGRADIPSDGSASLPASESVTFTGTLKR